MFNFTLNGRKARTESLERMVISEDFPSKTVYRHFRLIELG